MPYNLMEQIGQTPKGGRAVKQVFFTRKPDAVYAITPGWPGSRLVIRNIQVRPDARVTLLGHSGPLKHTVEGARLEIELPHLTGEQLPCLHAYTFKITGATLLPER